MKNRAKEILESHYPYWKNSIQQDSIIKAMIEFGKLVCDFQKEECFNNADIRKQSYHFDFHMNPLDDLKEIVDKQFYDIDYDFEFAQTYHIDKNSILNCKNVCDDL